MPQGGQAGRIELVDPSSSDGSSLDEPRTPEHRQMLRDGRLGDAKMLREFSDGTRLRSQAFDQSPPRRVGEGRNG